MGLGTCLIRSGDTEKRPVPIRGHSGESEETDFQSKCVPKQEFRNEEKTSFAKERRLDGSFISNWGHRL